MRRLRRGQHGNPLFGRKQPARAPVRDTAVLKAPGAAPEPLPQRPRLVPAPPWPAGGDGQAYQQRPATAPSPPSALDLAAEVTQAIPVALAGRQDRAVVFTPQGPVPAAAFPAVHLTPVRPPVPPPPARPDIAADLARLPLFREALARRTRGGARECLCGRHLPGDAWGGRMVAAGIHLLDRDAIVAGEVTP